jgi:signal transduction histidine kinase
MSKPAIICVDDEPTVLESLKIELKQVLGDACLIETAESGEEALELLEELQSSEYEVALVLADQIMPGIHGDELLKQIHLLSPQTLNIMITGHADLETLGNAIRNAKLYCYIAKPWGSDDLRSTILEAIQSYHSARKLTSQNADLQRTIEDLKQTIAALRQSQNQLQTESQQQESLSRVYLSVAMQQSQLYQAMQEQVKELENLNQLKDNFLDAVSHELRSPVSNIRLATQMLEVRLQQSGICESGLQCDRYFQILKTECQREADLINDMLALIQLDSGTDSLNLATVSLNLWIPHIIEPFIERIQEREQQLCVKLPPVLPTLTTDLSHLERSLAELLNNACKYTPAGETITVTVQIVSPDTSQSEPEQAQEREDLIFSSMAAPSPEIWISISNTGVEIPAEEHEQLFNQFYRLANSSIHQTGTGLGLTIAKKRIEKLRGTISVSSQPGETTFTVKLPLHLFEP